MAAFMYLGATITPIDEDPEVTYHNVKFINPMIMEENYRSDVTDIAKRYRTIKSVDETLTIIILPVYDYDIGKRALLKTILTAEFDFGTLLKLSQGTHPIVGDTMYIESGLGGATLDNLIPSWYTKASQRISVRLVKTLETLNEPFAADPEDIESKEDENP